MASGVSTFHVASCSEKERLGIAYMETVRDLIGLQVAEAQALIEGRPEPEKLELTFATLREKRDNAKMAYVLHVNGHGC
jgi:hypothetical protein